MTTSRKLSFLLFLFLLGIGKSFSQQHQAENLIVVVLDGLRWQEVFTGADSALVHDPAFTKDKNRIIKKFWDDDVTKRREKLFPFFWQTVVRYGQLYGNRRLGNKVNVSNPFQLTYPGFSEMLTGFADPAIRSNSLVTSQSDNVLEHINAQEKFNRKVAVFATSDLFPYLLNKPKSKLYINADTDTFALPGSSFQLLNNMQRLTCKPTTERPDLLTYFSALEYCKAYQPRVMYLALGETDAYAHAGDYNSYLETALAEDRMIQELWNALQRLPQYKNKTALLLTCDHGRGNAVKEEWTKHGPDIKDSGETWIAVMGAGVLPKGEMKTEEQLYQKQLAATIADVLGLSFRPATHQAAGPVAGVRN